MKVIKANGLVPVKALRQVGGWGAGEIFGITPDKVRIGLKEGSVELVDIPADVEFFEIDDPIAAAPPSVAEKPLIEIPSDWETMHHLKRFALAQKIAGKPRDQRIDDDEARSIIKAEVDKRAAEV